MNPLSTKNAPAAIGPYSQAIQVDGFLYTSGQVPLSASGELVDGDIGAQSTQVFENLRAVLAAAGCGPDDVIKTTVFLDNFDDFGAMNEIYASFFGDHRPARSTVEVSRLPLDVLVEIELVARIPE